ncbi:cytochrome c oxidase assembly protein [Lysobacter sp. GX 14042]|uniref:cytochrome c oxidase assembly protein n=1 Tax=Lysobacter sp. GX 14042 TaxID=2907155 RepID=UPI00210498D0|nr:cytochrome c oxidase assembly protein [Lysobacter sp. GX 14042]
MTSQTLATAVLLAVLAGAYGLGVARLWRRAGIGVAISPLQVFAFAAGLLALLAAFAWPLAGLEHWSLAAFVTRHLLLLSLAPALVLAGRPGAALAHVVPTGLSSRLHRRTGRVWGIVVEGLGVAAAAHVAVLLAWHLPDAVDTALRDPAVHTTLHISLLVAGFWFWAAVLHRMREPSRSNQPAVVAVVAVAIVLALAGMLLPLADGTAYALHAIRSPEAGLDAAADHHLARMAFRAAAVVPYLASLFWLLERRSPARLP